MKSSFSNFRRTSVVLMSVCLIANVAFAAHKKPKKSSAAKTDVMTIPVPKPGAPVDVDKKDLKNPTLIKHYFFTIQAPKGWSVVAAGSQATANAVTDAMVSLTPTNNTERNCQRRPLIFLPSLVAIKKSKLAMFNSMDSNGFLVSTKRKTRRV
jgi:hypothetical protein